jgi:hypothetical protein
MVFDQLENLVQSGGSDARLLAYANLAAELVDTMRGLVLAHMALDTEWQRAIEPTLNLSQRSRLIMHQQALSLPNAKEREELLRLWISRLTEPEAPYPWPFSERHLNQLLSAPGLTPRMLLVEFQRALDGDPAPANEGVSTGNGVAVEGTEELGPNDTSAGLDREWEQRLRAARAQLDAAFEQRSCVDAARVSDGLLACGRFLRDVQLRPNGVKREPAQLVAKVKGEKRYVALLQQGHPRSLGSALQKLTAMATRHSVWALRERVHELPPTWKGHP